MLYVYWCFLLKEIYFNVKEDVYFNLRYMYLISGFYVDEKWIDQEVDGEVNEGGGFWDDDDEGIKY